jgi:hypothetical protein
MSIKKLLLVVTCISQAACVTAPARMSFHELSSFKVDCSRREEQYRFLESQKYSEWDRLKVAFQMTSVVGYASNVYNGTVQDSADTLNFKHEAMIKHAQNELRQECAIKDAEQRYLEEQARRLNSR